MARVSSHREPGGLPDPGPLGPVPGGSPGHLDEPLRACRGPLSLALEQTSARLGQGQSGGLESTRMTSVAMMPPLTEPSRGVLFTTPWEVRGSWPQRPRTGEQRVPGCQRLSLVLVGKVPESLPSWAEREARSRSGGVAWTSLSDSSRDGAVWKEVALRDLRSLTASGRPWRSRCPWVSLRARVCSPGQGWTLQQVPKL